MGLVCYRDVTESNYIRCKNLGIPSGTSMSAGPGILMKTRPVNISVASFSASESLMCHQNVSNSRFAMCTVLSIDDLCATCAITKGPDYIVNQAKTGAISTAALSANTAVMCYGGGDAL